MISISKEPLMLYRRLGRSGLKLSAVSIGAFKTFAMHISDETAEAIMCTAYDAGVNYFDGAEAYAHGKGDELMGTILKKQGWDRGTYILAGKAASKDKFPEPTRHGNHRKHLRDVVDKSLRRFQTDYLDLFFCHRPDPDTPVDEVVTTMNHLIQQGKILYWGTSDFAPETLWRMHAFAQENGLEGPVVEQTWYNVLNPFRVRDDIGPLCEAYGMGVTGYSSLNGGFLTGKYLDGVPAGSRADTMDWVRDSIEQDPELPWRMSVVRQLQALADDLGATLPQLCLAWNLQNPHIACVLCGASRPEQIVANVGCIDWVDRLTPAIMQRIDAIMATPKDVAAESVAG